MYKIIKRLPFGVCIIAIGFLLVQIITTLWLPLVTADIVNIGISTGDTAYIWSKGYLMIGLSVAAMLGAICNTFLFSRISYKLGGELRGDIYRKTLSYSKHEFDKIGTSSLITRNTNDVTQVQTLVEGGLKFLILAPAMLIGGITMTALLSPTLAFVFLCSVPFLALAYFVVYRFASPLYDKMQRMLDNLNQFFREGLTGARVIRAFGKESQEYEKYKSVNREYTKNYITAGTIMSLSIPLVTMLLSVTTVIVIWVGGKGVSNGSIEIGSIMSAISYSIHILMGFGMLTNVILAIPRGQISANRINEVLDMPISINDPIGSGLLSGKRQSATALSFQNVDFRYQGAERKTLEDISFSVKQGQTLAIIGSTGDGKTTLVNLISRLYDVENGTVQIGGADVRDMEQELLHDIVSFSPQKSTLFFGTIRSNMLIAKPNATDDEIWNSLKIAHADEFVSDLDMAVEKVGGNFSGGQKQRLCIARALLKEASIYIFDDSFSALDFKTDSEVRRDMRDRLKNAITVIVAQRIGTVMNADKIAVLDDGKLAGFGTHKELAASCSVYKQIIDSQFKEEVVA
jgi:ABC-type multidrug transport system, ATPase and permease components